MICERGLVPDRPVRMVQGGGTFKSTWILSIYRYASTRKTEHDLLHSEDGEDGRLHKVVQKLCFVYSLPQTAPPANQYRCRMWVRGYADSTLVDAISRLVETLFGASRSGQCDSNKKKPAKYFAKELW